LTNYIAIFKRNPSSSENTWDAAASKNIRNIIAALVGFTVEGT